MKKWKDDAKKIEIYLGNTKTEFMRTSMKGVSTKLGKCELKYRLLDNGIEIVSRFDIETKEGKRVWKNVRNEYHNVPFVVKKDCGNDE